MKMHQKKIELQDDDYFQRAAWTLSPKARRSKESVFFQEGWFSDDDKESKR